MQLTDTVLIFLHFPHLHVQRRVCSKHRLYLYVVSLININQYPTGSIWQLRCQIIYGLWRNSNVKIFAGTGLLFHSDWLVSFTQESWRKNKSIQNIFSEKFLQRKRTTWTWGYGNQNSFNKFLNRPEFSLFCFAQPLMVCRIDSIDTMRLYQLSKGEVHPNQWKEPMLTTQKIQRRWMSR